MTMGWRVPRTPPGPTKFGAITGWPNSGVTGFPTSVGQHRTCKGQERFLLLRRLWPVRYVKSRA